jgi:hypothetical protein
MILPIIPKIVAKKNCPIGITGCTSPLLSVTSGGQISTARKYVIQNTRKREIPKMATVKRTFKAMFPLLMKS